MRALPVVVAVLAFAGTVQAATPTFAPPRPYSTSGFPPTDFATGDVNADGRAELVLPGSAAVGFLVGTADTGFRSPDPTGFLLPFPVFGPADAANVVVEDFNADGFDDALTFDSTTGDVLLALADGFGLLAGCGCFGPGPVAVANTVNDAGATGSVGALLAAGDLDLDGDLDFAVSDDADDKLYIFTGNGDYTAPATFLAEFDFGGGAAGAVDDVRIANLDTTNPRPEIAVLLDDGSARVLETGDGPLVYGPMSLTPGGSGAGDQRAVAGDVTGDGAADLIISDPTGGQLVLYPGGSAFGATAIPTAMSGAGLLGLGDLDADGVAELVAGDTTSILHVFRGTATGLTALTTIGSGAIPPDAVTTGDFDGDGRVDVVAAFVEPSPYDETVRYARNTSLAAIGLPTAQAFDAQVVGTLGGARSLTITNTGAAPLRVTSVRSDSDDFIVSGETCVGARIAAGAACQARVRFAPTAEGARSGTLTLAGNTASAATVALGGTGTAAPAGVVVTGPIGPAGPAGARGPRGAPGDRPVSRGHARCRIRAKRIRCVVYNARTRPWKFNELRQGRLGNVKVKPGRYRLTVIHADADGELEVFRRFVRVRR